MKRGTILQAGLLAAFVLGGCSGDHVPTREEDPDQGDFAVGLDSTMSPTDGVVARPDAGMPAPDGAMAEPDVARSPPDAAFECPAELREQHAIVATLDTYGGRGSFVATDGRFFVFTHPSGATVTIEDPENLGVVATSPIGSNLPAAPVDDGVFVLAVEQELVAFAATVDSDAGEGGSFVEIDRYAVGSTIRAMRPTDSGVVILFGREQPGLHMVRWNNGFVGRGNIAPDGDVRAIDVDGVRVAWLTDEELIWADVHWQCDGANPPCVIEAPQRHSYAHGVSRPRRLSLRGDFAALSNSDEVLVVQLADGAGREHRRWDFGEIQDVALDGDRGVFVVRRGAGVSYSSFAGEQASLDNYGASAIRIQRERLLSSGDIALARHIRRGGPGNTPTLVPISGPLHGSVSVLATDGVRVLMGGRIATALLDPGVPDSVDWRLLPKTFAGPRVIRMAGRDAALVETPDFRGVSGIQVLDERFESRIVPLIGEIAPGEHHEVGVSDNVLWDFGRRREPGVDTSHRRYASLRAWSLDSGEALGAYTDDELSETALRVFGSGDRVAIVAHGSGCLTHLLMTSTGSASDPQPRELAKNECSHRPPPYLDFADGRFLHASGSGTSELSLFREEGDAVIEVGPPMPLPYGDAYIPWMQNGRAWSASNSLYQGTYPLTRLTYDDDGIIEHGALGLPASPAKVIAVGGKTVVIAGSRVFIVAPGCVVP